MDVPDTGARKHPRGDTIQVELNCNLVLFFLVSFLDIIIPFNHISILLMEHQGCVLSMELLLINERIEYKNKIK